MLGPAAHSARVAVFFSSQKLRTLHSLSFVQEASPTYTHHCWSWYHEHKLLHRLDKRRADSTEGNRHPEPHWRRPQDPQEAGSFPLLLDTSGSHRHPSQQRCRHGISTGRACSRRASCPSRIESTPPTKVERRTCISFECHTDLLLEDCFDEMANDDELDSMFRQLQLLRRGKNLHSKQ